MVLWTGNINPAPDIYLGRMREQKLQLMILEETFLSFSISTKIVMDDKSYFPLKDDNINGNSGFYVSPECPLGDVPEVVRLSVKSKYPEKLFSLDGHLAGA